MSAAALPPPPPPPPAAAAESTASRKYDDNTESSLVILDNEGQRRFLMRNSGYSSYQALTQLITKIVSKTQKQTVPQEIIRKIAIFFTTKRLDPKQTRAVRASSALGQYSLDQCLVDSDTSWWISAPGSFRNGRGEEYVEFELGPSLQRLTAVHISIPPLPRGPMSVRTMRLDANVSGEWRAASVGILTVQNISGWQRIELLHPIDAQFIRVVCVTNQASRFLNDEAVSNDFDAVGFFAIKFE